MSEFKVCKSCGQELPLYDFTPQSKYRYGVSSNCKKCRSVKRKSRVGDKKCQDYQKKYYRENKETILADPSIKQRSSAWAKDNRETHNKRGRDWCHNNKDYSRLKTAKRRALKLKATPDWLTDKDKAHIKRTYKLANLMQDITGKPYHVDHIIPLKGETICGLHVPDNLQVLRADLNLQKSNKYYS